MNPKIISSLKNRYKLAKTYCSNPTEENKNLLTNNSNECSYLILKAKERLTSKLSKRLNHPSTMPKAYWSILKYLLK